MGYTHEEEDQQQSHLEELQSYFPHVHVWDPFVADTTEEDSDDPDFYVNRKCAQRKLAQLKARQSELKYNKAIIAGRVDATSRKGLDKY